MPITDVNGSVLSGPFRRLVAVTPGASPLPGGECRGLLASGDGTANLTFFDGSQLDGALIQKGVNAITCTHVRAVGGGITVQAGY